jgi:hypothetical protein
MDQKDNRPWAWRHAEALERIGRSAGGIMTFFVTAISPLAMFD